MTTDPTATAPPPSHARPYLCPHCGETARVAAHPEAACGRSALRWRLHKGWSFTRNEWILGPRLVKGDRFVSLEFWAGPFSLLFEWVLEPCQP